MLPLLCNQFSQEAVVEVVDMTMVPLVWKRNVELPIKL
jgi:hypothetical protein